MTQEKLNKILNRHKHWLEKGKINSYYGMACTRIYSTLITNKYVLVTDGIIEMSCVANSYKEATDLFLDYLKNQNDDSIYKFHKSGEIYEYKGNNLKTVHFIFNKHYIDILRSRK